MAYHLRSHRKGWALDKSGLTCRSESGLTLVELIITIAIVSILATAAIPVARFQVKRKKERELRRDLWEMRAAIDAYKDAADKGGIRPRPTATTTPPTSKPSSTV